MQLVYSDSPVVSMSTFVFLFAVKDIDLYICTLATEVCLFGSPVKQLHSVAFSHFHEATVLAYFMRLMR